MKEVVLTKPTDTEDPMEGDTITAIANYVHAWTRGEYEGNLLHT